MPLCYLPHFLSPLLPILVPITLYFMLLFKSFRGKKRWKEKSLIIIDLILADGENTNNSKLIQPPAVKNNLSLGKNFVFQSTDLH